MLIQGFSVCSLLFASTYASCLHATSRFPRRATAEGGVAVSTFGYTGLTGPLNWAGLAPENELCATGQTQSPINIDAGVQKATVAPVIDIPPVQSAEFENLGTTVETIINGTTKIGDATFNLKQFHLHTPSEHRINEEYFPLEMHMVHEAADGSGGIAVIAVLFQLCGALGSTDVLKELAGNLGAVQTPGTVTTTGALDLAQITQHVMTTPLFQYTGSLTTPPCAEGLTFLVTERPLPLDVDTFNAVKSVVKFNSRFTQNTPGQANLLARNGGVGTATEAPAEGEAAAAAPAAAEKAKETAAAAENAHAGAAKEAKVETVKVAKLEHS